jgi:DNA polymerase III alpha subunit
MTHNLLRVHSLYSVTDGVQSPDELAQYIAKHNISSYFPLTDLHNRYASVKQAVAAKKQGLSPVFGCDVNVVNVGLVSFFAKTPAGLKYLNELQIELRTMGHRKGEIVPFGLTDETPRLPDDVAIFIDQTQMVALSATPTLQANLRACFDVYGKVDLLRPVDLTALREWRLVPSVDVYYSHAALQEKHTLYRAAHCDNLSTALFEIDGEDTVGAHFHTPKAFEKLCEQRGVDVTSEDDQWVVLDDLFAQWTMPMPIADVLHYDELDAKRERAHFIETVHQDYAQKRDHLQANNPNFDDAVYTARLQTEIDAFIRIDAIGSLLTFREHVRWASDKGIRTSPGRGALPSSLVAYAFGLADIDPIRHGLLIDRFVPDAHRLLSLENRGSDVDAEAGSVSDKKTRLADILLMDIDFAPSRREEVVQNLVESRPDNHVTHMIYFHFRQLKSAIRVAMKLMNTSGVMARELEDALDEIRSYEDVTFETAKAESPLFNALSERSEYREIFRLGESLVGQLYTVGKRAAGIAYANASLEHYGGLIKDSDGDLILTLELSDVRASRIVVFNLLGLNTVETQGEMIRQLSFMKKAPVTIPEDDQATYAALAKLAIDDSKAFRSFYTDPSLMRQCLAEVKPNSVAELSDVLALCRPGPLDPTCGSYDVYLAGRDDPDQKWREAYQWHPGVLAVLSPTYGALVYQEQSTAIIHEMAGYPLGKAEEIRKKMGKILSGRDAKKIAYITDNLEAAFLEQGHEKTQVDQIMNFLVKGMLYTFLKSHGVSYALLMYRDMYLSVHHYARFVANVLTQATTRTSFGFRDKLSALAQDHRVSFRTPLPERYLGNQVTRHLRFSAVTETEIQWTITKEGERVLKAIEEREAKRALYALSRDRRARRRQDIEREAREGKLPSLRHK